MSLPFNKAKERRGFAQIALCSLVTPRFEFGEARVVHPDGPGAAALGVQDVDAAAVCVDVDGSK